MDLDKNKSLAISILVAAVLLSGSMIFLGFKIDAGKYIKADVKEALSEYITEQQAKAQQPQQPEQPKIVEKDMSGNGAVEGSKNAKVTIVEFSDFQCPYCSKFFTGAYPEIKKNYIDTGKVKLVFRNFPLDFHPGAMPAALAALCAKEQGGDTAFFKMHDKLFADQATVFADTSVIDATLKKMAANMGLNTAKFNTCLDSKKYQKDVEADLADASSVGISGTPSFIVGGRIISGAQPYASFKVLIDQALAK
jgi:protein-disulfide isomerase